MITVTRHAAFNCTHLFVELVLSRPYRNEFVSFTQIDEYVVMSTERR